MTEPANLAATWWSYAKVDPTILGVIVAVLAIAALAIVGTRVVTRVRRRR